MTSQGRDRRRGGPDGRRPRDWQNWNGQRSWGGDWHARGWSGDWRAAAWSDADRDQQNWHEPEYDADPMGSAARGRGADPSSEVWQRGGVPGKRLRIGDAERDQAVSLLSDHFVAGRLTQAEFEERSEQATRARYADELEPLFDELPTSMELQPAQAGPGNLRRRPGPPPAFLMIAPFLMVALVISSVALAAPWLLWGMFWVVMISGISRRRWYHHHR